MNPYILAGYSEEDAEALAEVAAMTGIASDVLITALGDFTKSCLSAADTARELDALARQSLKLERHTRGKERISPRTLGNMNHTAARPPARPASYPIQRGRKR